MLNTLYTVECQILPIIANMELFGVQNHFDHTHLSDLSNRLKKWTKNLENECYKIVGRHFCLNSHQEVAKILFCELKLALPSFYKNSGTSHYSTNGKMLKKLANQHFLPKLIEMFRKASHALNACVLPLAKILKEKKKFDSICR